MPTLSQAPLIEAILELRWGDVSGTPETGMRLSFPEGEADLAPGKFQASVEKAGFPLVERPFPGPPFPHKVSHRFRREANTWPCYQIGLGLFTANQINDGYDWPTFKAAALHGLEMLDASHPSGLSGLPQPGIELRYQDGFTLKERESAQDFLQNKLEITFHPPKSFLSNESLEADVQDQKLQFLLKTVKPPGGLVVALEQAFINGQRGFVMNTALRSLGNDCPKPDLANISKWLDDAHLIQKHAFRTLISPAYAKEFV